MNEQTVAILGILVTALIPFFGYIYKNRKELKSSYSIIWKASGAIKPKDVLGERPYRDYYYARKEDEQISECLRARKNILLIGPPLSGKSRAIFQALKNFPKRLDVLVPRCVHMQAFQFPFDFKFWKKKIIFIDDLQYYVEKQDYYHMLFNTAKDKNMMLIATCHSGSEFKKVKNKILEHQMDTDTIFGGNIIELGTVSAQVGKQIAEQSGTAWDNVKFNGTIGSIFMRLTEMEKRYDECDNIEKTILRSIKDLYNCGVYEENDIFLLDWIKLVAKYYELEGKDFEWTGWLKALEGKEFIRIVRRNKIWAEDAYLEYIVKSEVEISKIDLFGEMLRIFDNQPDALLMLAERAYDIGSIDIDISDYMKITIQTYRRVLDSIPDKNSYMYFETMNKLSAAYRTLAEVEDRIENCSAAVELLTKALNVKSIENSDSLYSSVQNNLGVVYLRLAEVSDRIENCLLAANAFDEALKLRTLAHSPREYAATKCNLGVAYKILSEAEDKIQNASKSVDAYLEGLKVYNPEEDSVYYAAAQNNLGTAYLILGEEEKRAENCSKAIDAFNEALKIRTYSRYPLDYAMTQNNLGSAYLAFAEVENTIVNCGNAIKAFEEALKVRTIDRFPFQYAVTQYNLGSAYMLLAEVKDKAENCEYASDAFKEALKVRTLNKFPFDYALIRYNLGCIYTVLAEQENKSENYRKAIESFDESLKVYDESSHPRHYDLVQKGITRAKKIFF